VSEAQLRVLRVYHSGVVRAWRERDTQLRANGCDVTLVAPLRWNEGGRDVALDAGPDEQVRAVRTFGRHPFRFAYDPRGIWRALRAAPIDVLDIHEEPASLATFEVRMLARLAGVRAPVCLYSAQNLPKLYPPPFRWFERGALRTASAIHTCNDSAGEVVRAKGFSGRLRNLGLGVGPEYVTAGSAVAAPTVDGAAQVLRLGFVGRLTRQKGVDLLVRAVAAVEGVQLRIVGDGPLSAEVEALVTELGVGDRVELLEHRRADELPELYRAIEVLVAPSIDTPGVVEQFGRVVVEAEACGAAALVSDSGSLPWVGGDAAVVVHQGDIDALASAIGALRDDPTEVARLRALGPVSAARFSWSSIAAQQSELYRTVLRDACGPVADDVGHAS
jgi:glycosyltransferase involved in cell wall biosynthesis